MRADPRQCHDDPRIQAVLVAFDATVRLSEAHGSQMRKSITGAIDDLHFGEFMDTAAGLGLDAVESVADLDRAFRCYSQLLMVELMTGE